jgi:GMP synthase (glutamine-hydrolysing)
MMRLVLLIATEASKEARENFGREVSVDLDPYDATERELPDPEAVDGAIITGSRASTYWDEPWIDDLRTWLRNADEAGIPLLGVCFGHQILAEALGGTVADMGEYELGYREIERREDCPLFEEVPEHSTVFATHHDAVTDLPPGASLTAENEYGIHGYRRDHAFGVQFHPEFDRETAVDLIEDKDLPTETIEAARTTVTDENVAAAKQVTVVLENFCDFVHRGTEDPTAANHKR